MTAHVRWFIAVALLAAGLPARAAGPDGVVPSGGEAPRVNPNVGIEEKVGAAVPLDAPFRDEDDKAVTLRQAIGGKPTILVLAYYRCPQLCTEVLNSLEEALHDMPQDWTAGDKFNVVTVSFDPKEHGDLATRKRASYLEKYARVGADWRFLTGPKESVNELLTAVGYKVEFDKVFKDYNHPTGIIVLTPDGRVARYFLGLGYGGTYQVKGGDPKTGGPATTTLRLSLVEASEGKLGSLLDRVTLWCAPFDHPSGKHSLSVRRALKVGGVLTVLGIGLGAFFLQRADRRRRLADPAPDTQPPAAAADRSGVSQ